MKPKTIAAAALAITLAAPVDAAPIELDLTFSGLTATFYGLHDDVAGAQVATSFDFTGALDTYTVAIANPLSAPMNPVNGFTFVGGAFTTAFFSYFTNPYTPGNGGTGFLASLIFESPTNQSPPWAFAEESYPADGGLVQNQAAGFTATVRPAVSPVPLPAGGVLLLTALAGAAALKRRKKITA